MWTFFETAKIVNYFRKRCLKFSTTFNISSSIGKLKIHLNQH